MKRSGFPNILSSKEMANLPIYIFFGSSNILLV